MTISVTPNDTATGLGREVEQEESEVTPVAPPNPQPQAMEYVIEKEPVARLSPIPLTARVMAPEGGFKSSREAAFGREGHKGDSSARVEEEAATPYPSKSSARSPSAMQEASETRREVDSAPMAG